MWMLGDATHLAGALLHGWWIGDCLLGCSTWGALPVQEHDDRATHANLGLRLVMLRVLRQFDAGYYACGCGKQRCLLRIVMAAVWAEANTRARMARVPAAVAAPRLNAACGDRERWILLHQVWKWVGRCCRAVELLKDVKMSINLRHG